MEETFKILLVDDKPENIIALEDMLTNEKRTFLAAYNGNDALKLLLKHTDVGLVMLDVQMPDMDGFEVASLIKANPKTKHIAIIFVTAINKEANYVVKGFEEGAVDYLSKPLDVQITRAKVQVFERLYRQQKALEYAIQDKEQINAQLERFMYVVAHDLKSPLSGVISLIDYIQTFETADASPELKQYLGLCMEAVHHLNAMIGSILEYSKEASVQQPIEDVDTQELVTQLIRLLYPPPHIHVEIVSNLPVVRANKLKLQQVFQNFISNAIKHNDKPVGHIAIGCKDDHQSYYSFFIQDNGPGISQTDHERIFKLFETAGKNKNDPGNTGIGLNVVKFFVEERGGKITLDSVEGEGAIFSFTWPK